LVFALKMAILETHRYQVVVAAKSAEALEL